MTTEIQTKQGNYTFKVIPLNNKSWREADDLEAVFILETDDKKKSFRGKLTLFGIIKK